MGANFMCGSSATKPIGKKLRKKGKHENKRFAKIRRREWRIGQKWGLIEETHEKETRYTINR